VLGSALPREITPFQPGGLRRRLVVAFGATSSLLIVATLIPLGFVLTRNHRAAYIDQIERQGASAATAVVALPQAAAAEVRGRFPPDSDIQALLVDRSGVRQTLVQDPSVFPEDASRLSEVRAALAGRASSRYAPPRVFVAVPITRRGTVDGALWLSAPSDPVETQNSQSWAALGIIGAAGFLFAILVAVAVSRQIARRMELVAAGAERFADGRFGEPIDVRGTDEIGQLGTRLNEMARRIELAVARERDFAAAASHQLRTPLTAIKLRLEEMRTLGPGDETVGEYTEEMIQEVDRLTLLTSGLLLLAATEGGGLPTEPAPASDAVTQAVERLKPVARNSGVDVRTHMDEDGLIVAAPRGAFEEVLFNLLDNAVKYSPTGGQVDVTLAREDGRARVMVADRGPGLSAEDAQHAFEPFFRSRRTGATRGSGLGLTICRRLCDAAGAGIELEPREGGGTVATVLWPLC